MDSFCSEHSMLPRPGYLFPSPDEGSFQPLFIQISFLSLALFLWDPTAANFGMHDVVTEAP